MNYLNEYFPQRYLIGEYSQLLGINKGCVSETWKHFVLGDNFMTDRT